MFLSAEAATGSQTSDRRLSRLTPPEPAIPLPAQFQLGEPPPKKLNRTAVFRPRSLFSMHVGT